MTSPTCAAAWAAGDLDGASGLAPDRCRRPRRTPTGRASCATRRRRSCPSPSTCGRPTTSSATRSFGERSWRPSTATPSWPAVLAGQATRADAPDPADELGVRRRPRARPSLFDPAAAKAGLTAAGWTEAAEGGWTAKGGTAPLVIEVLCPEEAANPASFAVAGAIAEYWEAIGLNAVRTPVPGRGRARGRPSPPRDVLGGGHRHGHRARPRPLPAPRLDPGDGQRLKLRRPPEPGPRCAPRGGPNAGRRRGRKAAYVALQANFASGLYLLPIAFRDEVVVVRDVLEGPEIRAIGSPGDRFWDVLTWRLADGR